uniref:Uncharacterized protein n=1 Tax=Molossus molossus TaxID=27622 RepID=A0A7J8CRZ4_MOLMO|nr:hypothetical protein HJG59_009805 [Molossus molossus]
MEVGMGGGVVNRMGHKNQPNKKYHTESFYLVKHQATNDASPSERPLPCYCTMSRDQKRSFQTLPRPPAGPAQRHHPHWILEWSSSTYRVKGTSCWSLQARGGPTGTFQAEGQASRSPRGPLPPPQGSLPHPDITDLPGSSEPPFLLHTD